MTRRYDADYLLRLHALLTPIKMQSYAWLNCKVSDVVVDAGCGLGHDAGKLAESGAQIIGIDLDTEFLTQAICTYGHAVDFRPRAVEATGLQSTTVDKFRMDRVLQHIANPEPVMAEIGRVLKPNGVVQIVDSDYHSLCLFMPDIVLERKITACVVQRFVGAKHFRTLPDLLYRSGFGSSRIAVHQLLVYGFQEAGHLIGLDDILDVGARSGQFTSREIQAWQRWKASETCVLSLNLVLLQAHKECRVV